MPSVNIRQEILDAIKSIFYYQQPQNRPESTVLEVEPVGNDVIISDQLINSQLLAITAIDNTGAIITGDTLWNKIASLNNVTDVEKVAFFACVKTGFSIISSSQLKIFILESDNISITLNGGHNLTKVMFWRLAPEYLVEP